ncbi:macrophage colony-stimulating factor 1 receptor [Elgaria multicarinata webbii]|uniref:macrophage colony-stimulating factor 1 receptor n=1 Tax=Elgaria multicarinata webbii TaxID=159646 RepID=UPI002FCD0859
MDLFTPGAMGPAVFMLLVAAEIWHASASPTISPNNSTLIVKKGDPVRLHCSGNSSVQWVGINTRPKVMVYDNGTLYIPQASCQQMGNYRCGYVNSTEELASVFLLVKDPRSVWCVPFRKPTQVTEGSDVLFPCLITDPGFTGNVTLQREDEKTVPLEFSFSSQEGIRLHRVRMEHQGWYQCQALVQGQWVNSLAIGLIVNENFQPIFVTTETESNVRIQGEPFNATCSIYSPSYIYNTNWTVPPTGNVIVTKLETYDPVKSYITVFDFFIPSVQSQDSGKYTCFGGRSSGFSHSSVTLQVIDKGYLRLSTVQNKSQEKSVLDSLKLQVLIEAYPRPHTYRWTHRNPSGSAMDATYTGQMSFGKNRYNNTLNLNWTIESRSGIYTFFADNGEANASISFNIFVKTPPKALLLTNGSNIILCKSTGYPAPRIEWYTLPRHQHTDSRCSQDGILQKNDTSPQITRAVPFEGVSVKSTLNIEEMGDNVTFCCLAVNSEGDDFIFIPSVLANGIERNPSDIPKPVIIACAGIMFLLLLCIAFLFYKYKQKPKYQVHWKIIEGCEGNNYTFIDPTQLPYNKKWEFPRNNLQFGKILGAGAFGKVIEATAFGLGKENSSLKVAVKMLKSTAHTDEQEALMSELKIMSHLGHHENIVNLLGACTHGGPVLVITEYCPYGDLLNFLRKKAECLMIQDAFFESSLDSMATDYKNIYLGKKYIRSDSGFGSQCVENYLEMRPVAVSTSMPAKGRSSVSGEETDGSHLLHVHDLLLFSNQVAQGMNFLASKNCIHRDLAARNVLVADGRVAKICDFGLARDIMNDTNYVVKGNARLPVKWMAPESIFECVYTVQSDVWSYGILLWEIFSLGRSPYPGMKVNSKFYSLVKEGYHMGRPDFAPEEVYHLLTACWNLEPTKRPTFNQICTFLQKQLDASKEKDYKNLPCATEEEDSGCEPSSYCEESCESGESGQPLLNSNNYQFC